MELIPPNTNIDFVGKRNYVFAASGLAVVVSLILFFTVGFNYGIDFTGGVEARYEFAQAPDIGKIRSEMEALGLSGLEVTEFQIPGKHVYSVKFKGELEQAHRVEGEEVPATVQSKIYERLQAVFGRDNVKQVSVDMVGPRVGRELRSQALWAILAALAGILIYVGFRFDYRFSPGGIIALAHDVIVTSGLLVALRIEFDLTILAALLTLAGYSINDTIVIFDRIRETRGRAAIRRMPLPQLVNRAINDTLSRTILTSGLTLLVVIALFFLGGPMIHGFAFVLLFGIIIGSYSTIYVASPVFIFLEERFQARRRKRVRA